MLLCANTHTHINTHTDGHHVLTLDSSAEMALVQLEVLNQIEEETGKKIMDMFEWKVASGIGGFLLLAMIYSKPSHIHGPSQIWCMSVFPLSHAYSITVHIESIIFTSKHHTENKSIPELRILYFQLWQRLFEVKDTNGKMKELERYAVEVFGSSLRMSDNNESK